MGFHLRQVPWTQSFAAAGTNPKPEAGGKAASCVSSQVEAEAKPTVPCQEEREAAQAAPPGLTDGDRGCSSSPRSRRHFGTPLQPPPLGPQKNTFAPYKKRKGVGGRVWRRMNPRDLSSPVLLPGGESRKVHLEGKSKGGMMTLPQQNYPWQNGIQFSAKRASSREKPPSTAALPRTGGSGPSHDATGWAPGGGGWSQAEEAADPFCAC